MAAAASAALVFEPEIPAGLAPLLEQRPFGLLPVAGRPLLHHLLTALSAAGVRDVQLFVTHLPHLTRDYVGDGTRWGLRVRCHSVAAAGQFLDRHLRSMIDRRLPQGGIAMGMDCLAHAATLRAMLLECATAPCRLEAPGGVALPCFAVAPEGKRAQAVRLDRFFADDPLLVDSPKALWHANARALQALGDAPHKERRVGDGVFIGSHCRLHESAQLAEPCLLGAGSVLERRVRIGAQSIIGAGAIIDEASEVRSSIVFDGTYVGPHSFIDGKLLDGCRMVDIASGDVVYLDDPAMLGTAAQHLAGSVSLRGAAEWSLAACAATLLAIPLLCFMAVRRLRGREAFKRERHFVPAGRDLSGAVGSRQLELLALDGVAHPAWRRAPWLLAVLAGRLRLFGTLLPSRRPAFPHGALAQSCAMLLQAPEAPADEPLAQTPVQWAGRAARTLSGWLADLLRPAARAGERT
jgi:hypothetical protein